MPDELDLDQLLSGLRARRSDPDTGLLKEALSKSLPDSPAKAYAYLVESMEAVPAGYTKRTFEESKRIEKQLESALTPAGFSVEFANQGSATNDTHIKVHSDIDLLVCTKTFYHLKPPLKPARPWVGDPVEHIWKLRSVCASALACAYPAANVDNLGAKALSITGGSLRRKVDVVPGSWLHGTDYHNSNHPENRGVQILDGKGPTWIQNYPFHHNREIIKRDTLANGNLRKLIRLLKSVRADAEIVSGLSSYDIAGFCFNIPLNGIRGQLSGPELLVEAASFAVSIADNELLRSTLRVPNHTRMLFDRSHGEMMDDLRRLMGACLQLATLAQRRRAP